MDHVYGDDYDGDEYECDDYNGSDTFEWQDMECSNTKTFFLPPNFVTKILCKVFPLTMSSWMWSVRRSLLYCHRG